jgi:hypothetical protein
MGRWMGPRWRIFHPDENGIIPHPGGGRPDRASLQKIYNSETGLLNEKELKETIRFRMQIYKIFDPLSIPPSLKTALRVKYHDFFTPSYEVFSANYIRMFHFIVKAA